MALSQRGKVNTIGLDTKSVELLASPREWYSAFGSAAAVTLQKKVSLKVQICKFFQYNLVGWISVKY